jgi:hypothetical protein
MNENYGYQDGNPNGANPYNTNQYSDRNIAFEKKATDSLLQWQLDPEEIIKRILDRLSGRYYDYTQRKFLYNEKLRQVNEEGIDFLNAFLPNYINKSAIMTKYDKDEIFQITMEANDILAKKFCFEHKELGVKFTNIRPIVLGITQQINVTVSRSKEGFFTKFLKGSETVQLTETQRPQEHQGVLGRARGMLRV